MSYSSFSTHRRSTHRRSIPPASATQLMIATANNMSFSPIPSELASLPSYHIREFLYAWPTTGQHKGSGSASNHAIAFEAGVCHAEGESLKSALRCPALHHFFILRRVCLYFFYFSRGSIWTLSRRCSSSME
jgi:hypothetical protein